MTWGRETSAKNDSDPERLVGLSFALSFADTFVFAATARGAADHLVQHLLDALFVEEAEIDEVVFDKGEVEAMRSAIAWERTRSRKVASVLTTSVVDGVCGERGCARYGRASLMGGSTGGSQGPQPGQGLADDFTQVVVLAGGDPS